MQYAAEFRRRVLLLWIGSPIGEVARDGTLFGLNVLIHGYGAAGFAFPQPHQALIDGNARQPRGEFAVSLELVKLVVGLQEDVLGNVFSIFAILCNVLRCSKNLPVILPHQLLKRFRVSSAGRLDQCYVGVNFLCSGLFHHRHALAKCTSPEGMQQRPRTVAASAARTRVCRSVLSVVRAAAHFLYRYGTSLGSWCTFAPVQAVVRLTVRMVKALFFSVALLVSLSAAQGAVKKHTAAQPHAKVSAGQHKAHSSAAASRGIHHPAAAPIRGKRGKAAQAAAHGRMAARGNHVRTRVVESTPTPQSRRLQTAFVATSNLRPMAQQLALQRTPAAFAGVQNYAAANPGEPASAAYLAMGHAYAADRHYSSAVQSYQQAASGDVLRDYAEYLGAQAALQNGDAATTIRLLSTLR